MRKGNKPDECNECVKTVVQNAEVRLPIDVSAYACVDGAEIACCGEPRVEVTHRCGGCRLEVKQIVSLSVSVRFGAEVTSESSESVCTDECSL